MRFAETSRAVFSTSESIAESDRVVPERYIKLVHVTLVVKLLVSLTCDLFTTLKAEHSKPISPFEIGFVAAVHMILLISNKDANIT